MVARNKHMAKLVAGYLFPEIGRRRREFMAAHPEAKVISLGIGDTTEPLTPHITAGLLKAASALSTAHGYSGYGDEQGIPALRNAVAERIYGGRVKGEEVFISDGAKPDTGRLQMMLGGETTIAVQDPSYPVYVDSAVIIGQTGAFNEATRQFEKIVYMPCTPENGFFPDLSRTPRTDLIFFCSPNNPTGAVATRAQLERLVAFARKNKSIILYDAAYAMYIRDPELPRSIFEIDGARQVALEINSFSKPIGFTGVRLGWTVVPEELCFDDGTPVRKDWNRIMTTVFNGASNIVQHGGLAALDTEGRKELAATVDFYMENAGIIRQALVNMGVTVYGGDQAPYIWAKLRGRGSWEAFTQILEKAHVVCTPGVGFGPCGEGFVRFSAFGHRENVLEAVQRLAHVGL